MRCQKLSKLRERRLASARKFVNKLNDVEQVGARESLESEGGISNRQ